MGKMNAGNWGALLQGGVQGAQTEQNMETNDLKNQYYKNAMVDPAAEANQYWTQKRQQDQAANGQTMFQPTGRLFDPVRNKLADVYSSAKAKLSNFLPGQGQHAMGPAAQSTVPAPGNAAMGPPSPTSSAGSGGMPGPTGPMPLPDQPTTQGQPYADGGIPGRGRSGALRMRKAKPGNVAKPTKAANAAMHPPMQKAPVDAQEMGAEGGPPRNTEASPGSQDPMLANGGFLPARLNPKPPKYQPQPDPNSFEKNQKNDDQLSRFSRVEKKFADGDEVKPPTRPGQDKSGPAAGLEPAEPESTGHHLAAIGSKFLGMTALDPDSPYQQASGLLQRGVRAAGDYLSSPWEGAPTGHAASPGSSGAVPAAPPPQQGPPNPAASPQGPNWAGLAAGGTRPDDNALDGRDREHAIPARLISPKDAEYAKAHNGMLPDGTTAGAYVVDTQGEQPDPTGQGMPPYQGPAGAAPAGPMPNGNGPIDFSQSPIDHRDIPDTSAKEWDDMKKGIVSQLIATRQAGPEQAAMLADNQVSQFQHENFMQYLQQAIQLDGAGNKAGAMAALKTGYNYMPTGHGMHFGLDSQNNIVGVGYNEDTKQTVGTPVKLDQANLAHLAATFMDPKNFQAESLAKQEQKRKDLETTRGTIPLQRAQAAEAGDRGTYYQGLDAERRDVAQMRFDAAAAARAGHMPPDISLKVNAALRGSGIVNPDDIFAATGIAAQLMQKGHSQADATSIAGMIYAPGIDPIRRAQFAAKYGIELPPASGDPTGSAIPPR